jgi:hypothetical protein
MRYNQPSPWGVDLQITTVDQLVRLNLCASLDTWTSEEIFKANEMYFSMLKDAPLPMT